MVIDGDGPFTGGKFIVELNFDGFPFKAPKVKFLTKAYHP
jgi:ubiquitin-protein ligase